MFPLALPHLPESLLAQLREQSARGRYDAVLDGVLHWERDAATTHGRYHPEALSWALVRGAVLCDNGSLADAVAVFLGVLRRARTAYGDTHVLVGAARAGLGFVYETQALITESYDQFAEALRILNLRRVNDPVGLRWLRLSVCDAALEIKAFEAARAVVNEMLDQPGVVHSPELSLRLGVALCGCGEGDEGETLIVESLTDRSIEPRVRAIAHEIVADQEVSRAHLDAAIVHLEASLADRRAVCGLITEGALKALSKLAAAQHRAGKLSDSKARYEELVDLLGPEQAELWKIELCTHARADLGEIYVQLGEYDNAERILQSTLCYFDKSAPTPLAGRVLHNLGLVLAAESKTSEARIMLDRALATREALLGDDHPEVAETLHALAVLRERLGDGTGARSAAERCLEIRHLHFEAESDEMSGIRELLERLPKAEGRPDTEETSQIEEPPAPAAASEVTASGRPVAEAAMLFNKAIAMQSGAQHWEALQLLAQVLALIEQNQGSEHRDLIPVLDQMAEVYGNMGFEVQARAYRERAERLGTSGNPSHVQ
jgi:tetratricopeptide (TPR) repeat protein